jgi:hypothetical protein
MFAKTVFLLLHLEVFISTVAVFFEREKGLCWLHRISVREKDPLRTIIRVCLQGSMKRANNQKVLHCSQTLFIYGLAKENLLLCLAFFTT